MHTKLIPLSLYIHIPWCIRKCPYCDFNSHALKNSLPEEDYIARLIYDLEQDLPKINGRTINTIFFGGGTPSLFSPSSIEKILVAIKQRVNLKPDIEITMEANPGTVEQERFYGFRAVGINRLSLGIQSFNHEKLKTLGRIHNGIEAINAIEIAKKAGFNNFNLDLMFGLPQQTIAAALEDLQIALNMQPKHLSWYQLTLEPNTYFYQHPPSLPADDLIWEMQQAGQALLAKNNLQQYEISAYSLQNQQCQHNLNYWEFGDYLGIGAGAHGKITNSQGEIIRTTKLKNPKDYLDITKTLIVEEKIIPLTDLPLEFMMNALRLTKKIPLFLFKERTGLELQILNNNLAKAVALNLLMLDKEFITVTVKGRNFLNNLLQLFLPDKR